MASKPPPSRAAWLFWLRVAVTIGLLGFLFSKTSWAEMLTTVRRANPWWMLGGLACAAGSLFSAAARWGACLRTLHITVPLLTLVRITLAGHAAGFTGLGAAGTDLTRGSMVPRGPQTPWTALAWSMALDHMSAIPVLLLIAGIALHALGQLPPTYLLAAGLAAMFAFTWLVGVIVGRFRPAWRDIVRGFVGDRRTQRGFAHASLLSIPVLLLQYSIFLCTARALAVPVSTSWLLGTAAAADTIAGLPLSVGGLGVREQAFVSLLGKWHQVPAATAIALSVAGWGLLSLWALVGAACFLPSSSPQPLATPLVKDPTEPPQDK